MTDTPMPEIDVRQAQQRLAGGAVVIDVRETDEWDAGHAEGAVLEPLSGLDAGALAAAHADRPVAVLCRSGNRSGQATRALLEAGHADVVNVAGGMLAWTEAGLPVVTGR